MCGLMWSFQLDQRDFLRIYFFPKISFYCKNFPRECERLNFILDSNDGERKHGMFVFQMVFPKPAFSRPQNYFRLVKFTPF